MSLAHPKDAALLGRPGGGARLFWRLLWREVRLRRRVLKAELDHEVLYGRHGGSAPVGILNVAATERRAT